jgi:hypothetical protein
MPLGPEKKVHLELTLEVPDLLAERRLGSVHAEGRPSEVKFLGNRDEVPKVAELHLPKISQRRGSPAGDRSHVSP